MFATFNVFQGGHTHISMVTGDTLKQLNGFRTLHMASTGHPSSSWGDSITRLRGNVSVDI